MNERMWVARIGMRLLSRRMGRESVKSNKTLQLEALVWLLAGYPRMAEVLLKGQ